MKLTRNLFQLPFSTKTLLLAILVLQNSSTALLGRYTRVAVAKADLYDINQFVFIGEVLKLAGSIVMEAWTLQGQLIVSFREHFLDQKIDTLTMAIPALLYWGSNTLLYYALSNLDVPTFQVASQGKLCITAIISVSILERKYSLQQWICLLVVSLSISAIVVEENSVTSKVDGISDDRSNSLIIGIPCVFLACFLSAFAGVFFEKVIKTGLPHKDPGVVPATPTLWMRNIQLSLFSALFAFFQVIGPNKPGWFHGFTPLVWCQVVLFGGGGLLVAAVIKYSDNVMKGLATGMSVLLSTGGSIILYGTSLTPTFMFATIATVVAIYLFSNSLRTIHAKGWVFAACSGFVVLLHLQSSLRSLPTHFDYPVYHPSVSTASPAFHDVHTDYFPSNWSSTYEALTALRAVVGQSEERSFHEATHILYDLRTALGDRPVKYLEIGSYTGMSASLVLSHPMQTFATLVDPCILPREHYKGKENQEATIRNNLARIVPNDVCIIHHPWELRVGYSPSALPKGESFDIIFIDGDHSTKGVFADYENTINLLRPGGFMVFDDYLDRQYSPEVRPAVDQIARSTDLIVIGSPANVHGIHPEVNVSFINEFIFQKKGTFQYTPQVDVKSKSTTPLLCIVVATYRREDGSTPEKLEQLWRMLQRQTYTNWKLYMTGDSYDNATEWKSLSFYKDERVRIHNLAEPGERGKMSDTDLWHNAGATAMNNAIDRLLGDGYEWAVHLDDDDSWDNDHLQNIVDGIRTGATFVMTQCQYRSGVLPSTEGVLYSTISNKVLPRPCRVIHSSVAFNVAKLTSRYQVGDGFPADAFMWSRIIFDEAFYPAFVPVISCHHLREGGDTEHGLIVRRSTLNAQKLPPGWYGETDEAHEYSSLAADSFPANMSLHCEFVVGPQSPPEDYPFSFVRVPERDIPYHILSVDTFMGLPVWKKVGNKS